MREPMPSPENMEENKMEQYKKEFIEFMVESQVLKFESSP